MKLLIISVCLLIVGVIIYFFVGFPLGCKKSGQTYTIGKESCCVGLDFAPTSEPNKNICLPKLDKGQAY